MTGPVPPKSAVPPSLEAVWLRETCELWAIRYSVGLNMHSSSVSPDGRLLPTQVSFALVA